MVPNNRSIGFEYEQLASRYLNSHGMSVIAMNYRCRIGEIDIVALDENTLVFVEVKYRKNISYGYPEEAVNIHKQVKIKTVASYFMLVKGYNQETNVRFDVIAILGDKIKHIRNAF